jgi:hypothetical protein
MDPRFVVSLSGRDYVLYAGILGEAHERGLQSIEVALIQMPGPDNDHTAIACATVTMKDGTRFQDFGDASPRNTPSRLATALIRMASTRSKGRALRDAINVGQTLLEELPGEEEGTARTAPGPAAAATPGFEPLYHEGGKSFHRTDLVAACLKDQALAQEHGIAVEPLDPQTATNEQLFAYGRSLRPKLRAAKALAEGRKGGPQKAEVVT